MNILPNMVLAMLLTIPVASANATPPPRILETDWLQSETGSSGNKLGAEVINVETQQDMTVIDVEIPLNDPARFETIQVIDKKSEKPLKTVVDPKWIETLDKDTHGLRLYFKKPSGFEFRLRLIDAEPTN